MMFVLLGFDQRLRALHHGPDVRRPCRDSGTQP